MQGKCKNWISEVQSLTSHTFFPSLWQYTNTETIKHIFEQKSKQFCSTSVAHSTKFFLSLKTQSIVFFLKQFCYAVYVDASLGESYDFLRLGLSKYIHQWRFDARNFSFLGVKAKLLKWFFHFPCVFHTTRCTYFPSFIIFSMTCKFSKIACRVMFNASGSCVCLPSSFNSAYRSMFSIVLDLLERNIEIPTFEIFKPSFTCSFRWCMFDVSILSKRVLPLLFSSN